jgi:hypothetical protein
MDYFRRVAPKIIHRNRFDKPLGQLHGKSSSKTSPPDPLTVERPQNSRFSCPFRYRGGGGGEVSYVLMEKSKRWQLELINLSGLKGNQPDERVRLVYMVIESEIRLSGF